MSERQAAMDAFLARAGWADAACTPVPGDASTRRYTRLERGGIQAVLMDAPKGEEAPGEPEGATVELRRRLGYNAMARVAGPNIEAFLTVAEQLYVRGFSAPRIIAADPEEGFALLEDLGRRDYACRLDEMPELETPLYEAAVDVLAAIYRSTIPRRSSFDDRVWTIRDYDEAALMAEADLLIDWFAPDIGRSVDDAARSDWHHHWGKAIAALRAHTPGLALRDYHAQNLFWLPDRTGQAQVGLIDFQDALFAHPAYDLASLLEDARRDVSPELHDPLITRFCAAAGLARDDAFDAAYAVTAAQRNAKILGIFVRLAKRDGKPHYRTLIPRVRAHFKRDLSHPACDGLRGWFATHVPEVLE
ncbi:phosphotransferase [uncultured Algimonas sp.]|uniref:aminoglycoside phosphotransferase family protein n=1 Tax=uncultured Algimonas sp. TaxID=1547920 RepID=UPI00260302A6|nr:phosphotransferase [uncultured Algimonas sp.]